MHGKGRYFQVCNSSADCLKKFKHIIVIGSEDNILLKIENYHDVMYFESWK